MNSLKILAFVAILLSVVLVSCRVHKNKPTAAVSIPAASSKTDSIKAERKEEAEYPIGPEYTTSTGIDSILKSVRDFVPYATKVQEFYAQRNFKLAWSDNGVFLPQAAMFMNILRNTDKEGLNMAKYHPESLNALYKFASEKEHKNREKLILVRKQLDVFFTAAFFDYAQDEWQGRVDPKIEGWNADTKKIKYSSALQAILDKRNSKDPFTELEPEHPEYHALKVALSKYRAIEDAGGWPTIPSTSKLGDTSEAVFLTKKLLYLTGDLLNFTPDSIYTPQLKIAVQKFQQRHGITPDGIIDKNTLQELNVTISDRITQLLVNMERWRWVPDKLQDDYIMINIPEFTLHVIEKNKEIWNMKVIVGQQIKQTPIFNSKVELVVVNPNWTVPHSIAIAEMLPSLQQNPGYLSKHDMELLNGSGKDTIDPRTIDWNTVTPENFSYTIRQKPGGENALGTLKFLFPNDYSVYMHDTPAHYLFAQQKREFSHGCIRLEQPLRLAQYLLKRDSTTRSIDIDILLIEQDEKYIKLKRTEPVYILYFTAWVDSKGQLNYRPDYYGHDADLKKALFN